MRSGAPHRGGLPGQLGGVTRLAGVSFLHVNAEGEVPRLAGVMSIRAFVFKSEFWISGFHQNNIEIDCLATFSADFLVKTSRKTVLVKKILTTR